ncbi:Ras GTPase [Pelomyxa schiedti]|nr:Ras GTPase [Pelomyxa schiedti]
MDDSHVNMYKVVVVGDGGVGKSAITIQLTQGHFITEYDPTIENSYRKPMTIDNDVCVLDILDTAGQEEYAAMRDQYFRSGHGFIIVFSVVDRPTFENVQNYRSQILKVKEEPSYPMVICANKVDIPDREVQMKEGQDLARTFNIPYLETSAKLRQNIEPAFIAIVQEIKKHKPATDNEVQRLGSKETTKAAKPAKKEAAKGGKKGGGCNIL